MTLFVSCRRCNNTIKADDAEACAVGGCPLCGECWELYGYCEHHSDEETARVRSGYRRRNGASH